MSVSNRRFVLLLLGAAILPALAACGGTSKICVDPSEPYLSARSQPPLRTPEGLTQPDRSAALTIPEAQPQMNGQANRQTTRSGSGCLAEPPSYFRSAGTVARSPEEVVASWAQAWSVREADAVIALYSSTFSAPTESAGSAVWLEQRREQVATGPVPDSMIEGLKVEADGADRRIATFVQKFGTNSLHKQLTLVRESGSWRIVEEKVAEVN